MKEAGRPLAPDPHREGCCRPKGQLGVYPARACPEQNIDDSKRIGKDSDSNFCQVLFSL